MSRSDRLLAALFLISVTSQVALGLYRARVSHSSIAPALVLAAIFATIGLLFFAKRRGWAFAFLARPAAVALIAIGVMSTPSAIALPIARGSLPLFAFSSAALLILADRSLRALAIPLGVFVVSVIALEITLTNELSLVLSESEGSVWAADRSLKLGCVPSTRPDPSLSLRIKITPCT